MKANVLSAVVMLGISGFATANTYIGAGVGHSDYGIDSVDDPTGL